ncbi:BTAD domain-containing putative transcriptional regulator [Amycolatopsis sp. lyj-90]|uniref:AfsR/SARP family transcriptional regulator n=1 Tax=Amycolatopsis sp. lyj-90 TaxID=2789285 RepID=UPI0039792E7F
MKFHLLGPLEVLSGGEDLTPTAPKVRQVLALLLLRHNRVVHADELVDELWGEAPPASARATLQTYIYKLRQSGAEKYTGCFDRLLRTRPNGYLISVHEDDLDLHNFEQSIAAGSTALEQGDPVRAADELSAGLSLWRGAALSDVVAGSVISAAATALAENRLRALELRIEADLRLGGHRSLIGELKELLSVHPLHEVFHTQLMVALQRSGRRLEAIDEYQRLRKILVDELGIEPSAASQDLYRSLLSPDAGIDLPMVEPRELARAPITVRQLRPAQLPSAVPDFTGRERLLAKLTGRLLAERVPAAAAQVVLLTGRTGVGKTAAALQLAQLARTGFDGGQLIFDLQGSGEAPVDPLEVLHSFLTAAGMPADELGPDLDECAKLFRSWCSGRQVLVVLDDAASAAQVAPLIPGNENCAVLITSRRGLHGLPCTERVELEELPVDDGVTLLARLVGTARIAAEPEAAEQIVRRCGRLPLAIRAIGARLMAERGHSLRGMADRLSLPSKCIEELSAPGLDFSERFETGYRVLAAEERSAVRALSLGTRRGRIPERTAAQLLGGVPESAGKLLHRLVDTHFLRVVSWEAEGAPVYEVEELSCAFVVASMEKELVHGVSMRICR